MDIKLVKPSMALKEEALNFRQEHFDFGEEIINGSELFDKIDSYEEWLTLVTNNAKAETVDPNWVVTDTFFAVNSNNRIIGIIDLRHTLNDFLINFGNCGYSVRPSERHKGIATEMLKKLLTIAKNAGMNALHLSVEQDNIPSIKTIKKNGGLYERSFVYENKFADIYKINL